MSVHPPLRYLRNLNFWIWIEVKAARIKMVVQKIFDIPSGSDQNGSPVGCTSLEGFKNEVAFRLQDGANFFIAEVRSSERSCQSSSIEIQDQNCNDPIAQEKQ